MTKLTKTQIDALRFCAADNETQNQMLRDGFSPTPKTWDKLKAAGMIRFSLETGTVLTEAGQARIA